MTAEDLSELAAYPRIMQKLLRVRGITTRREAEVFLTRNGSIYDPLDKEKGIKNMSRAVSMIWDAVDCGKKIAVYGDYDVDGITASTILVQLLQKIGAPDPVSYIPDRFEEGYGLNKEALKTLSDAGIDLVITVDCGIRSTEEAIYARELGLKLIISGPPVAPALGRPRRTSNSTSAVLTRPCLFLLPPIPPPRRLELSLKAPA